MEIRRQMLHVVTAGVTGLALATLGSESILLLGLLGVLGLACLGPDPRTSPWRLRAEAVPAGGPLPGNHPGGVDLGGLSLCLRDGSQADDDFDWSPDCLEFVEDDEEISFLPPYATDEPEDDDSEDPAEEDWTPPFETNGTTGQVEVPDSVEPVRKVPIPRHFALGTVAIIRRLLEPAEVAQILLEQRRQPRLRFGDLAIQMGLLDETQLRELLLTQQEGLFTDNEIREARARLRAFREMDASRDSSVA